MPSSWKTRPSWGGARWPCSCSSNVSGWRGGRAEVACCSVEGARGGGGARRGGRSVARAGHPSRSEDAVHGGAREREPFMRGEQFSEVLKIDTGILRAGEAEEAVPHPVRRPSRRGLGT